MNTFHTKIGRKVSFPYLLPRIQFGGVKQIARKQNFQFNLG